MPRSYKKHGPPYPVNFSNGVWKYTLVVYSAKRDTHVTAPANATAHLWTNVHERDPATLVNDHRSYSTRKSVDSVNRKMCPETSWPLRSLGVPVHSPSGSRSEAGKSAGCVNGEIVVRV